MNELTIMNQTCPIYKSAELNKATRKIFGAATEIKSRYFEIAATIAAVAAAKSYEADGFADVHAWTNAAFGIKKTTSYDMVRIGRDYIRQQLANGRVKGYETNLVPDGAPNFTSGQIVPLLSLGREKAGELVDDGEVTPDMSIREIKKVVKAIKESEKGGEPEKEGESVEAPEREEASEENAAVMVDVTDEKGGKYRVPYAVLILYRID